MSAKPQPSFSKTKGLPGRIQPRWWLFSICVHLLILLLAYLFFWPEPKPDSPGFGDEYLVSLFTGEEGGSKVPSKLPDSTAEPIKQVAPTVPLTPTVSPSPNKTEVKDKIIGTGASVSNADANKKLAELFTGGGKEVYEGRTDRGRKNGIRQYGGNAASENSVELGLRWLLRHQDSDGKWDAAGFTRHCKEPDCKGAGTRKYTPALTALAMMCFLGAGYTPENGQHSTILQNTRRYLVATQNEEGFFGGSDMYNHALVLLSLVELYGQTKNLTLGNTIRRGVLATEQAQQPQGGWTYEAKPTVVRNDSSITGWQILSLYAAKRLGFAVPEKVISRAHAHLRRFTLPGGEVRYADVGPNAFRQSDALSAVGLLCALLSGQVTEVQRRQAAILQEYPPTWQEVHRLEHSMYYWYHGTLAAFLLGGNLWRHWNEYLRETLVANQVKTGEAAGSWPPVDKWGNSGGRLYSTTFCLLNLEIYYRYQPTFLHALSAQELAYLRGER